MRGNPDLDSIYIGQVLNAMSQIIQKNSQAQEKPAAESSPSKSLKSAARSKSLFTDNYLFESWNSDKNKKNESKKEEEGGGGKKQEFQEGQVLQMSYRYGNGDVFKGNCVVVRGPNTSLLYPEILDEDDIDDDTEKLSSKKSGSKKLMVSTKDTRSDGFDRLPRGLTIIRHGHGVFRKKEGDLYIGEFQDDKMSGYGVYKYSRHTTVVRHHPYTVYI